MMDRFERMHRRDQLRAEREGATLTLVSDNTETLEAAHDVVKAEQELAYAQSAARVAIEMREKAGIKVRIAKARLRRLEKEQG